MIEKELNVIKEEINGIFGVYVDFGLKMEECDGNLYVVIFEVIIYNSGFIVLSVDECGVLEEFVMMLKNNFKL